MGKKEKGAEKASSAENIKVIVRCRPLNSKEKDAGYKPCVDMNLAESTVQVNHVVGDPDRWTFDAVVNNTYTQRDVFTQFIMPMVDSVMDGFNATVFAYGQSGSGKTHTMTGKLDDEELKGIIPRTFEYVFHHLKESQRTNPNRIFSLSCSFVELYNGKIHDLLAKQQVPLAVKENKDKTFFVQGVYIPQVKFADDLVRHMEEGTERRRVASTDLNADSSRSHSLFTLIVDMVETDDDGTTRSVTSKFNLVDLAGSERQSKTGAAGDTLKEGCNINLSLSALGTVIDTLVKGKGHVPFRSSPLTMLLKDSLGGSSKTVMFANIGPSEHNLSETVSTLRFADRAKQIKNKPVVNLDSKDQKIQELTEQVNELREKLKQFESVGVKKMEEELEQLRERVGELEVDLDNAVKGREADALESHQARDSLAAELDKAKAALAETEAAAATMATEATLHEEQLRDERAQREEIWAACTAHFGEAVGDVDALLDKLRQLATSVPKEEHLKAVAELRSAAAESGAANEALQAEVHSAKTEAAKAAEEVESLRRKLDKAKDRLEKEKDARKMLIEGGQGGANTDSSTYNSPTKAGHGSNDAFRDLEGQVAQLKVQLASAQAAAVEAGAERGGAATEELAAVRGDYDALRKQKDAQLAQLQHQLDELGHSIADAAVDDAGAAVANLKRLLKQKQDALDLATQRIAALEARIAGGASSADDGAASHAHHALEAELTSTASHRDDLLRAATDGAPVDAAQQLHTLTEENARLRQNLVTLGAAAELEHAKKAAQTKPTGSSKTTPFHNTDVEAQTKMIAELQAELDAARAAANDVEANVLKRLASTRKASKASLRSPRNLAPAAAVEPATGTAPHPTVEALQLASDGEEEEEEENPMASVIDLLQRDKAHLTAEVARLHKELRLLHCQPTALAAVEETQTLQAEVDRLNALLSAPQEGEAAAVSQLKEELARRDDKVKSLRSAASSNPSPQAAPSEEDAAELRRAATELASKLQMADLEKAELLEQLDAARADAAEATAKEEAAKRDAHAAAADVAAKAKEASDAKLRITALENRVAELEGAAERVAAEHSSSSATLESLQARLKERTDQMAELRKAMEHMKVVAEDHKGRAEALKRAVADKQQELAEREVRHQQALAEQEQAFQKLVSRRLEAQAEDHKKALARKDDDIQAAKKKVKKFEEKIEKLKEKYDSKVYEYEELVTRMEEQKFEAMRNLRGREQVEMEVTQERVQDALKAAKEQQRRKADMFANGEVNSAVSGFRNAPAGSAAQVVRSRGGTGTPPSEDIGGPRRSPRPAGYQVGKAITANPSAGGAGYTGYVSEQARQPNRPMNQGFEFVPDSHLDSGASGDIYDF